MVSELRNSWSWDLSFCTLWFFTLVSDSGFILILFIKFFCIRWCVYYLFDILSNWKFFFKPSTFCKIFSSQSLILFFSTSCTLKNGDYFSTSDCSISYYSLILFFSTSCTLKNKNDANSSGESWNFRICWWLKKISKLIWCRFWSWRCWNWWSSGLENARSNYRPSVYKTSRLIIILYQGTTVTISCLAPPSLRLRGNVKISKALVLPHVKRLKNAMVRMLLVVVSLVCQLRELVSIV